ncbi:MAG: UDP-glucose/GDP-mannose dehydrogenase family protein [Candidatus Liptonbacteria bacterium]|nr:UDP-glucose/GDP-mannose dehydrogenase family protein [Candidatus Liptonbacteria bacterium]
MVKIGVIGLWHLGEVYSAGFAEAGHSVVGVSDDEAVIANFNKNIPPLAEPRLTELIEKHRTAGTLAYSSDWLALKDCNAIWITFDTPVDDQDEVDISVVVEAVEKAAPFLRDNVLVGVSSQLPVGTSKKLCELIRAARPELHFEYVYSPENLRLGDAVKCFLEPGRVVLGGDTSEALARATEIFAPLKVEIVSMSVPSAEMAKHALNAFLATCISFTNDLADVSGKMGGDIEDVIRALKSDPRVGPKAYLFAGLGFSGGTLARDLKALIHAGEREKLPLPVIQGVLQKNRVRNELVKTRLEEMWGGNVRGKTIALLGVTYKAGTPTLRRSQALEVEKMLREAGASFRLYDPLANPEEVKAVTPSPFFKDAYEAAEGADAVLIITPSKDFKTLDFAKLQSVMKQPALFDAQNILCDKEKEIKGAGITYISIGR